MQNLWKLLSGEVIAPMCRRVGTLAGGALIGIGVAQPVVDKIEVGLAAACGVALDLTISYLRRKAKG